MFLKNFAKLIESFISRRLFSNEGWRLQIEKKLRFRYIPVNFAVVKHVQTAASDIFGCPYVGVSSAGSTVKKCKVCSSILVFIHFKLVLESCTTSGVYLEQYQISTMKLLFAVFSQKRPIIDIWQGSKCCSAALFCNIFPLLFGYLNEYMSILFFFWKCPATLFMWCKLKILYDISLIPKLFPLYWPWKYQIFIYDKEAKKLALKNFKMECKADVFY